MPAPLHSPRVQLTLTGTQTGRVQTSRPSDLGEAHLIVSAGPVMTYCYDARDALAQHDAWVQAVDRAAHVFPDGYTPPTIPDAASAIAVRVTATPGESWDVTGYTSDGAPDRVPCVFVRVGPIVTRCLDYAAAESLCGIWFDAALAAHATWRPRATRPD